MIYPNFRDVDGELFIVLHKPDGEEVLHEKISAGEAWRLVMQLLKYLKRLRIKAEDYFRSLVEHETLHNILNQLKTGTKKLYHWIN